MSERKPGCEWYEGEPFIADNGKCYVPVYPLLPGLGSELAPIFFNPVPESFETEMAKHAFQSCDSTPLDDVMDGIRSLERQRGTNDYDGMLRRVVDEAMLMARAERPDIDVEAWGRVATKALSCVHAMPSIREVADWTLAWNMPSPPQWLADALGVRGTT